MDWKEFFNPSGKKVSFVVMYIFILIFIGIFSVFASMDVTSNAASAFSYLVTAFMPFSIVPTLFPFQNYLLNAFYFYLLGCIFAYPVNDQKKKWYPLTIGISLMVLMGILSVMLGNAIY